MTPVDGSCVPQVAHDVTLVGVRVAPGASASADGVGLCFAGSRGAGAAQTLITMEVVSAGDVCRLTV